MIGSLLFSEDVERLDIFTGVIEELPANESNNEELSRKTGTETTSEQI